MIETTLGFFLIANNILILFVLAAISTKMEKLRDGKEYKGFFEDVLLKILFTGGISYHFLPFPFFREDFGGGHFVGYKKINKKRNKVVVAFWLNNVALIVLANIT